MEGGSADFAANTGCGVGGDAAAAGGAAGTGAGAAAAESGGGGGAHRDCSGTGPNLARTYRAQNL